MTNGRNRIHIVKVTGAMPSLGGYLDTRGIPNVMVGSWLCKNVGSDMAGPVGWRTGLVIWTIAGIGLEIDPMAARGCSDGPLSGSWARRDEGSMPSSL